MCEVAHFGAGVILRNVHITVETAGAIRLCDTSAASGVAQLARIVSDVAEVLLGTGEFALACAVEAEVGAGAVFDAF